MSNNPNQQFAFFNFTAEVEYIEEPNEKDELPKFKYRKVSLIMALPEPQITNRRLAAIYTDMQMKFRELYHRDTAPITKVIPDITNVVIVGALLLGIMTHEKFKEGMPTPPEAPKMP